MAEVVRPLDPRDIVAPLLPSLPVAAVASQPASAVLPLLSPILRQRVQFLSASSSEPWIRLLSYDPDKAAKLVDIARSARFEPHPVSGEIEIDWESCTGDVEIRYKRLDVETLQAFVLLRDLDLVFRLVHCQGDDAAAEGSASSAGIASSSGWRVGEVSVPDEPHAFALFGGYATAAEAERMFSEGQAIISTGKGGGASNGSGAVENTQVQIGTDNNDVDDDDDDDDDYWARYDATPARTPAVKRSPAPASLQQQRHTTQNAEAEDAYYAQYDSVQPAMDNHDPDEVVVDDEDPSPGGLTSGLTFGLGHPPPTAQVLERVVNGVPGVNDSQYGDGSEENAVAGGGDGGDGGDGYNEIEIAIDHERLASLVHPRPASASSHGGSSSGGGSGSAVIVSKLEESAGRQEQSEFGVKQHVSRSIKSLYMLARASGIDRDEFEQLVKTELDMLSMMEE